ncbi:hypothetical protein BJ742DRAFT_775245 [Cladochytrium replicatum]|nr:hypothetical protein BJ742DRAFT_775245 [Cladochytrium replicatum]
MAIATFPATTDGDASRRLPSTLMESLHAPAALVLGNLVTIASSIIGNLPSTTKRRPVPQLFGPRDKSTRNYLNLQIQIPAPPSPPPLSYLETLPVELLIQIAGHLDLSNFFKLSRTSARVRRILIDVDKGHCQAQLYNVSILATKLVTHVNLDPRLVESIEWLADENPLDSLRIFFGLGHGDRSLTASNCVVDQVSGRTWPTQVDGCAPPTMALAWGHVLVPGTDIDCVHNDGVALTFYDRDATRRRRLRRMEERRDGWSSEGSFGTESEDEDYLQPAERLQAMYRYYSTHLRHLRLAPVHRELVFGGWLPSTQVCSHCCRSSAWRMEDRHNFVHVEGVGQTEVQVRVDGLKFRGMAVEPGAEGKIFTLQEGGPYRWCLVRVGIVCDWQVGKYYLKSSLVNVLEEP